MRADERLFSLMLMAKAVSAKLLPRAAALAVVLTLAVGVLTGLLGGGGAAAQAWGYANGCGTPRDFVNVAGYGFKVAEHQGCAAYSYGNGNITTAPEDVNAYQDNWAFPGFGWRDEENSTILVTQSFYQTYHSATFYSGISTPLGQLGWTQDSTVILDIDGAGQIWG